MNLKKNYIVQECNHLDAINSLNNSPLEVNIIGSIDNDNIDYNFVIHITYRTLVVFLGSSIYLVSL